MKSASLQKKTIFLWEGGSTAISFFSEKSRKMFNEGNLDEKNVEKLQLQTKVTTRETAPLVPLDEL